MAKKRSIQIEIDAKTGKAIAAMGQIDNSVKAFARAHARSMKQTFGDWNRMKMSVMAVNSAIGLVQTALASMRRFASVFIDISKSAMLQSSRLEHVKNALSAHNIAWEDARQAVLDFSATIQRTAGIADDETQDLIASLASMTVGTRQSMDSLLRLAGLAQDVSYATGQSIETVGRALARVVSGNAEAAKRVLPGLTEDFKRLKAAGAGSAEILDVIEDRFGGMRTRLDPLRRDLGRVTAGWGDLKEALGDALNNALNRSGAVGGLADAIDRMAETISTHGSSVMEFFAGLATTLMRVAAAATNAANALSRTLPEGLEEQLTADQRRGLAEDASRRWANIRASISTEAWASSLTGYTAAQNAESEWEAMRRMREDLADQLLRSQPPTELSPSMGGLGTGPSNWTVGGQMLNFGGYGAARASGRYGTGGDGRTPAVDPNAELLRLKETSMAMYEKLMQEVTRTAEIWRGAISESLGSIVGSLQGALSDAFGIGYQGDWKNRSAGKQGPTPPPTAEMIAKRWKESMSGAFDGLGDVVSVSLSDTMGAIGQFAAGVDGAFKSLGERIKATLGQTFSSIGGSFLSAATQIALSSTGGPLGWFFAIGGLFSLLGGLLTGLGGGGGGSSSQPIPSMLSAVRPDMLGGGGSTIHQHLHIGAVFADHDEAATHAVARYAKRAQEYGEWRL